MRLLLLLSQFSSGLSFFLLCYLSGSLCLFLLLSQLLSGLGFLLLLGEFRSGSLLCFFVSCILVLLLVFEFGSCLSVLVLKCCQCCLLLFEG